MSWKNAEADMFVVCMFRRAEGSGLAGLHFTSEFESTIRENGGNVQLRTDKPQNWDIIDGQDHHIEPNHLNPAIFDFNSLVLAGFNTAEQMHTWWNSDKMFELLKYRGDIEKMGIFTCDGLQQSFDSADRQKMNFGDRIMLFEFVKLLAFKPMQNYVDAYKRASETAVNDIGAECNLFFAESISGVLMNEFPLEAACASSWRGKAEARLWCDADKYQDELYPLRKQYSNSLALLVPIYEERLEDLQKQKAAKRNSASLVMAIAK
eukprot:CAMPEP_0195116494 /NCGR_PEP_ID=MMETSP0448-20130528/112060_1 /TAXON_ID=66468 /ORGANISM="Heterocapsa triquestra, Strain CCMP 448" /LENGTH=263 /DNA_ID=CAMNT_0040153657 /DNA_START=25 /DNA_END=816 /DNA_ORIENTATION=-